MQKAKSPMKINKITIIIIALIVWAVFSLLFIANSSWRDFKDKREATAYNAGMQEGGNQGFQQAILQIAQVAQTCQNVPLNLGKDKDGNDQIMNIKMVGCPDVAPEETIQE